MRFLPIVGFTTLFGCAGAVEAPDSAGRTPAAESPAASSNATPAPAPTSTTAPNSDALTGADAPCDVRAVLRTYCVDCHQVLVYSPKVAPKLTFTRSELMTRDDSGLTLAERVLLRLNDPKDPMPPVRYGVTGPSDAERRLVSDWLRADMPGGACSE